jgi:sec-independent protein translocase protein TatA
MGKFGMAELLVILLIVLLLFGGAKIPQLAKSLGEGIREFKKSIVGKDDNDNKTEKNG